MKREKMNKNKYDVVVVGSGAAGGFAVKELTERGFEVLLLEAGRAITAEDFKTDFAGPREKGMQLWARAKAALAGQPVQSKVAMYAKQLSHLFVNDREHPYSTPSGHPFLWIRGKQLGGRLHTYGRMLLRWSDYDFKAASRDGQGEDWPIGYEDLAPYYDQVEGFLGIRGCPDHVKNVPDGNFAGLSKLSLAESEFKRKTMQHWPDRQPIAWRYMPPNIKRVPQPILAATATGLLTVRTDAIAQQVITCPASGKATGVSFVDRNTRERREVEANIVVLCASPIETVRLMLNSAGTKHPGGLGNGSGVLGRYFMDQVPSLIMGTVPGHKGAELDDSVPADPFYGVSGGIYIPRFENLDRPTHGDFVRGYAYQGTIGRLYTPAERDAKFGIMGFGEMLPYADNTITLNPKRSDRWGMPIPHIDCRMHRNELAMLAQQVCSIEEMASNAGLKMEFNGSALGLKEGGGGAFPDADPISRFLFRSNFRKSMAMGAAIHESGGARMGNDPATSILNPHNQCWEAPNVFVTDASSFVTGGCAGTTLTLMALTVRACEYIAAERSRGQL
ncbi:GMC oxidoreductase [Pseudomonas sp. NPDC090592]|uniref:GMC oxidoreductase n=1 Tax=Pseudomonas sp. NPDC090592 TaxID=3364480 RepID=UPI00383B42F0